MYSLSDMQHLEPILHLDGGTRRQDLPTSYVLNGALYLASREFLLKQRGFISHDTVGYVMPVQRSVDIDTPLDWQWAEFLMDKQP